MSEAGAADLVCAPIATVTTDGAAGTHASGVIASLPELAAFTSPWRSTSYAPDHPTLPIERRFPPHVTVLTPFAAPDDAAAVARLRQVTERHASMQIVFSRVDQFGPGGAVWLVPEPVDAILGLVRDVIAAFPEHPPYEGLHPDPVPHLTVTTVGDAATLAQVRAALDQQGPLTVQVHELGVWYRGDDGVWQLAATAPLGGRTPAPTSLFGARGAAG